MVIKISKEHLNRRCEEINILKYADSIVTIGKRGGKRFNEFAFAHAFIAETGCSFHKDGNFYDRGGREMRPESIKHSIVNALADLGLISNIPSLTGRLFRLIRTLSWVETPLKTI